MILSEVQIKPLILLGAGGHAKVLLSLINELSLPILGVSAPELVKEHKSTWRGLKVLGPEDKLIEFNKNDVHLVNGIGQLVNSNNRRRLFEKFTQQGYYFPVLIHPRAYVDPTAILAEGVQVMAGAVIQADSFVGKNVIINTHVTVDHDCKIDDHIHIAAGATLCGNVYVSSDTFIATGSCIAPGINVGEGAVIGAGVSIVRDVASRQLVMPALVRQINLNTLEKDAILQEAKGRGNGSA